MLAEPAIWLKKVSPYEVELLKELAEAPAGTRIMRPTLYFPLPCLLFQLLQVDDSQSIDEKINAYYLTDDVHAAVSSCIFGLFDQPIMKEHLELQQYGYGLLTLYGVVPIDKFSDEIECFPFVDENTVEELTLLLGKSFLFLIHTTMLDGADAPVLVSPWVEDAKKVWKEIKKRKDIPYKDFEYGEIMDAGLLPNPIFETEYDEEVFRMLDNDDEDDDFVEQTLTDTWFCVQMGSSPSDSLQLFLDAMCWDYEDLTNDIVQTLTNYQNSLPRWDLKGHSPKEAFEMGIQLPEKKKDDLGTFISSNGSPIVNATPKIGRNDPCPCGSGKKYKNCCGKN